MFKAFQRRTKGLDYWDVKMIGASCFIIAIIVVRFVPELVDVNHWWLVLLCIILLGRPLYHFWIDPSNQ